MFHVIMKKLLLTLALAIGLSLTSYAEKYSAVCTRISKGNSFEQIQVPCSIEMEIGRVSINYPKQINFVTETLDSQKNGVTTYTVRDSQGKKYRVHLSLNPFEEGTMILNISDYNTEKLLWGYVLIYK